MAPSLRFLVLGNMSRVRSLSPNPGFGHQLVPFVGNEAALGGGEGLLPPDPTASALPGSL